MHITRPRRGGRRPGWVSCRRSFFRSRAFSYEITRDNRSGSVVRGLHHSDFLRMRHSHSRLLTGQSSRPGATSPARTNPFPSVRPRNATLSFVTRQGMQKKYRILPPPPKNLNKINILDISLAPLRGGSGSVVVACARRAVRSQEARGRVGVRAKPPHKLICIIRQK